VPGQIPEHKAARLSFQPQPNSYLITKQTGIRPAGNGSVIIGPPHSERCGFTLMEILVALGVLAVLVIVSLVAYKPLLARADAGRCMANMRGLHVVLSAYIQDRAQWPQEPRDLWEGDNEAAVEDWWIEELKPYGAEERVWQCPTLARQQRSAADAQRMHYAPTRFDARPFTPFRWAKQPWLIEIGNMHGRGAHILFPDGSIRVMSDFVPPGYY
jgi:prepilin-type N-terminal cleavage/methylation domain-containing protein